MAGWAVGLLLVYLALAFGVRVAVALRTTGGTGIAPLRGAPPRELLGGARLAGAKAMGLAPPIHVRNVDGVGYGLELARPDEAAVVQDTSRTSPGGHQV